MTWDGTTLEFTGGEGNEISLGFTLVIEDDDLAEGDEDYGIQLDNPQISVEAPVSINAGFINTTIVGTPTCRASRICSRVWGMGPSAADTTRMAPSI